MHRTGLHRSGDHVMSEDFEARITELECRIAMQEDLLQSLNSQLHEYQQTIQQLQLALDQHSSWIKHLTTLNLATQEEETPPPHY